MGAGEYENAIPLEWLVHEKDKKEVPDSPGQYLYLACAYWCLEDRARAIELAHALCAGIMDRSVNMAPDRAGGATFGLVLHYLALTAGDEANLNFALSYLRKLNVKYYKKPERFHYPVETVKQLLGEVEFERALEGATGVRDLGKAYRVASRDRSAKLALGVALFHDGALQRSKGNEVACKERMQRVFDLGYQTESICWYLARHEVGGLTQKKRWFQW